MKKMKDPSPTTDRKTKFDSGDVAPQGIGKVGNAQELDKTSEGGTYTFMPREESYGGRMKNEANDVPGENETPRENNYDFLPSAKKTGK